MSTIATSNLAAPTPATALTVLKPSRLWSPIDPAELWRYRDLLWILAKRDIQVRYKQTALGAIWALLQPLVTMGVMSLVLGRFLGAAQMVGDIPYPLFLLAGLLPWMFFAASVTAASTSLVGNAAMVQKVYFPRLIVPLAALGAPMIDALVAFGALVLMVVVYQSPTNIEVLLLPLIALTLLLIAAGIGIALAALTVSYRDFRFVVPFALQVWFFITPVILPARVVPTQWRWLLNLNPLAGVISAFRAAALGTGIDYAAWGVSVVAGLLLLAAGLLSFSAMQRRFADVV